jgi:hypothetical protein
MGILTDFASVGFIVMIFPAGYNACFFLNH